MELLVIERNQGRENEVIYVGVPLTIGQYKEKVPRVDGVHYCLHHLEVIGSGNKRKLRIETKVATSIDSVIAGTWYSSSIPLTPETQRGLLELLG
jgi:hypothetical protein